MLVLVVAYMNTENYIITPDDRRQGGRPVAAGHDARCSRRRRRRGVPGALAATPLIGTVKAVYLEARYGPPVDAELDHVARAPRRLGRIVSRLRRLVRRRPAGRTETRRTTAAADPDQRRANLRVARGRKTATITAHQISARTVNQAALWPSSASPLSPSTKARTDPTIAVIGWFSATGCIQPGIESTGT